MPGSLQEEWMVAGQAEKFTGYVVPVPVVYLNPIFSTSRLELQQPPSLFLKVDLDIVFLCLIMCPKNRGFPC
jgi:hypothetical protein